VNNGWKNIWISDWSSSIGISNGQIKFEFSNGQILFEILTVRICLNLFDWKFSTFFKNTKTVET
jgi:hypothetical protein